MSMFGNQYKCDDCGAVWDAGDTHECAGVIPFASEVRGTVFNEMTAVKEGINQMLVNLSPETVFFFKLSAPTIAHLRKKGYKVVVTPVGGSWRTQVSI